MISGVSLFDSVESVHAYMADFEQIWVFAFVCVCVCVASFERKTLLLRQSLILRKHPVLFNRDRRHWGALTLSQMKIKGEAPLCRSWFCFI